ncbi:MAG: hypothetical protein IKO46_06270 [Salinivirgaceae bacterium]|nr:hypothetical protein [Salinivirgaceae bacterium]
MAVVSLNYNPRNKAAKKAIEYMLSTGFFTLTETPLQERVKKVMESAKQTAQEFARTGGKGMKTLDDLLGELDNED